VEVFRLLQDSDPRKASLIDFQYKALEEFIIILEREAVLGIVIFFIEGIVGVGIAVIAVGCHELILLYQKHRLNFVGK
jgi:hypothetical protein